MKQELPYRTSTGYVRLRYNPHAWHVDGATLSLSKAGRERWLCTFLSELALDTPLTIGYAFYDSSEGKLEVLANDEYHPEFARVAVECGPLALACRPKRPRRAF